MIRLLRGRLPHRGDDAGTTLLELIVGMTIMTIFLSVFTTAVYQMSRASNEVEAVTTSGSETNQAFLQLDKLVRYASAISTAGRSSGGTWYVELDKTAKTPTDTWDEMCTQLRIDKTKKQLQKRTWTITGTTVSAASSWSPVADDVTNGAVAVGDSHQPFTAPATTTSPFQQLTVTLVVTSGGVRTSTTNSSMTFTAVNSVASATSNASKCQEKGRP